MSYPDNLLRGVPNEKYLIEDGTVGQDLFYFTNPNPPRSDGGIENSINWDDDPGALTRTFAQTKSNGELQFRAGAVRIPREELDRINRRPTVVGLLSYERSPLPDNTYHGNLLIPSTVSTRTMKMIAAGIALAVSEIIPRP